MQRQTVKGVYITAVPKSLGDDTMEIGYAAVAQATHVFGFLFTCMTKQ